MTTSAINVVSRGDGFPLIFLHGFPLDHHSMLPLDRWCEGAGGGWRRHYLDMPGFGLSPAPDHIDSSLAVAEAVVEWIQGTIGSQPFAIIGHSFGGLIARSVAAQLRERVAGIALLAPVARETHELRDLPEARVAIAGGPWLDTLPRPVGADFASYAVVQTPEVWEAYRDYFGPGLANNNADAIARIERNYALPEVPEDASGEAQCPSLFVLGRYDSVVGYRDQVALATRYPQATVAVLDEVGHMPQIEAPELTGALVQDWLARVRRSTLSTPR